MECRTPTKRSRVELEASPTVSPKFTKPSDLFRKRARKNHSPNKLNVSRRQLTLEKVSRLYSPLKCLQINNNNNNNNCVSPCKSPKAAVQKQITFSPLMKKLQRSPGRSSVSFPVVKRVKSSSPSTSDSVNPFGRCNRVLNFCENANLPDKANTSVDNGGVHPLALANIDWSIKTKLRLYTNRSMPFHGSFKVIDEVAGLNHFVRGSTETEQAPGEGENFSAELKRHCFVWQFPSLPWIKMFPRSPDLKPGSILKSTAPLFSITPNSEIADSLYSQFCSSIHSLFKLLKSKYCPYFYMCANNYTVLFRASGVAGSNDAHALISPTTNGFRKLLTDEGIEYVMPCYGKFSKNLSNSSLNECCSSTGSSGIGTNDSSEPIEAKEDEEDNEEESENANTDIDDQHQWLESLGLSQQDFPSLQTSSLRRRRMMNVPTRNNIDDQTAKGKMKSLVRVDGLSNCQTLLGLLINNRKICIPNSGPWSGIPPTLLAPIAFDGATLTPINVKQKSSENQKNIVSLDLSGPILPHSLHGIMNLFGRFCSSHSVPTETSPTNCTIVRSSLRTFDASSSFALENRSAIDGIQRNLNPTFAVENLLDSGLDRRFLTAICTSERQLSSPLCDFELSKNGIRYNISLIGSKHWLME